MIKGLDFSKIADTNEGMYAAEDDLGTSYYFRGAVDNNWVKIGKDSTFYRRASTIKSWVDWIINLITE